MISFFTNPILLSIAFFILGHILGWFAGNAQLVWEYWKDKAILSTLLFGTPAGLFFWYGTKFAYESIGSLWSVRFLAAALSYFVFPVLTWYLLDESMFTLKTMLSISLAWAILIVQFYL